MKKIIFFTVLIISLNFLICQNVFALGQMSEPIIIENALRGNEYQELIIIVNNEKTYAVIDISAEGAIADWVKFYAPDNLQKTINNINISARENKNINAIFTIPEDMPNGKYTGLISVTKKPENMSNQEGSLVSISQKIDREVTITIGGEEKIGLQVSVIPESYDIAKNKPLNIRFIFDNLGNVSLRPQIDLKIKNLSNEQIVYNAIYPYPESEMSVRPNAQYEIPAISVPTNGLEKGKYLTEIEFLHNNQSILLEDFKFNIGATGFVLGIKDIKINWYIIGGAILIILIALAIVLNKKFKIKNSL